MYFLPVGRIFPQIMTWRRCRLPIVQLPTKKIARLRSPAPQLKRQHRDVPQWPRIAATRRRNARRQKRSLLEAALDHKSNAARKRSSARAATRVNILRDLLCSRTTRVKEIFFSPLSGVRWALPTGGLSSLQTSHARAPPTTFCQIKAVYLTH